MKIRTTGSGEDIDISKMTDSHIINSINMVQRKSKEGIAVICDLGYAPDNNYKEYDSDVIFGKDVLNYFDGYYDLLNEAKERKILQNCVDFN